MKKGEKAYVNTVILMCLILFISYNSIIWIYIMGGFLFIAPFLFKRVTKKIVIYNFLFFVCFSLFVYFFHSLF
ncbi:hypothetical protein CN585_16655 [Bacillus toyonensis]|uniref:Uncharacterized protein n=1 Tax=Bacillus toyonensis TaxID=155322 RepID=A0A2A8HDZ1_9BACI|nr:hypothetical protein CN585_16655 [Bacillus toyonensis]